MSWLTRFLGFDEIIIAKDSEIVNLSELLHKSYKKIDERDDEIRRLTDLMLTEHGIILREGQTSNVTREPQPVNQRFSWTQRARDLERKDRELAQKLSSEKEEYWKTKDTQAHAEGLVSSRRQELQKDADILAG